MRILVVCRSRAGNIAQFITEQVDGLRRFGVDVDYFLIENKGVKGYLKSLKRLKEKIAVYKPDIIHAHYGLAGLFANLQRQKPVVTTYLGSDINYKNVFYLSKICMFLSAHNIFVSNKNLIYSKIKRNFSLVPFGVELSLFKPIEKSVARKNLNFSENDRLVLFAGKFQNKVKNAPLAQAAVDLMDNVKLLPMGGYTREEVVYLFNAVDAAVMTSFTEGSPQFIKEAMACNCPIVSTDVGDVKEVIGDVPGCFIVRFEAQDVANKLQQVLTSAEKINGRGKMTKYDNEIIITKIIDIYNSVLRIKNNA